MKHLIETYFSCSEVVHSPNWLLTNNIKRIFQLKTFLDLFLFDFVIGIHSLRYWRDAASLLSISNTERD